MRERQSTSIDSPRSRHTTVTQLSHNCHTTVTQPLHSCYTAVPSRHATIIRLFIHTPVIHTRYTPVTHPLHGRHRAHPAPRGGARASAGRASDGCRARGELRRAQFTSAVRSAEPWRCGAAAIFAEGGEPTRQDRLGVRDRCCRHSLCLDLCDFGGGPCCHRRRPHGHARRPRGGSERDAGGIICGARGGRGGTRGRPRDERCETRDRGSTGRNGRNGRNG